MYLDQRLIGSVDLDCGHLGSSASNYDQLGLAVDLGLGSICSVPQSERAGAI